MAHPTTHVNLSAHRSLPAMPAYIAAKSGLIGLTHLLLWITGPITFAANVICPGASSVPKCWSIPCRTAVNADTGITGALNRLLNSARLPAPLHPDRFRIPPCSWQATILLYDRAFGFGRRAATSTLTEPLSPASKELGSAQ